MFDELKKKLLLVSLLVSIITFGQNEIPQNPEVISDEIHQNCEKKVKEVYQKIISSIGNNFPAPPNLVITKSKKSPATISSNKIFIEEKYIFHLCSDPNFEDKLYPAMAARYTAMPVVPEGAKQSTLNINSIHGGQAEGTEGLPAPCVPYSCRMIIDRRCLVEEELEEVKSEVVNILSSLEKSREGFSFDIRDMLEVIPSMTDSNSPVVKATVAAIEDVLGITPELICSPGTYDQKHIDRIGNLKDCIAYGPGILELAHQPDEYVVVEDMINSAKVMASSTYKLLSQ